MPKTRTFFKYWLPVLLWMWVIFSASGDTKSMEHSSRIIGPIVRWLFPHLGKQGVEEAVLFARKCAHLTEYGILAVLMWRAFRKPATSAPRPWQWADARWTALLVLLYAATDEFHQRFVVSRQASVVDVLIDTAGGIVALILIWSWGVWRERRRARADTG